MLLEENIMAQLKGRQKEANHRLVRLHGVIGQQVGSRIVIIRDGQFVGRRLKAGRSARQDR
jgi:hypothetical protein